MHCFPCSGAKNFRSCSGYQDSYATIERKISHHVRYFKSGTSSLANDFCLAGSPTICRHMILQNIGCLSFLIHLADHVFTLASLSLLNGKHLTSTRGKTGLACTAWVILSQLVAETNIWPVMTIYRLVPTNQERWPRHLLWACGFLYMMKNGMEMYHWA